MGFFDKFKKKEKETVISKQTEKQEKTLAEDIPVAAEWAKDNLTKTGYEVDYNLESMKEVERFFIEQSKDGGVLTGKSGSILFSLGCLIGETIIRIHGGEWVTNDDDPQGEINIAVKLPDDSVVWPVQRCMKRLKNGTEENIYDYVYVITQCKHLHTEEEVNYFKRTL